jgi:uncharacterized protein (TIGR00255 family)
LIRSMTGYGNARREGAGLQVQVDLRSVNNRFFDFQPRLPRELSFLEGEMLKRCKKRLGRGRVSVQVILERGAEASRPKLDTEALAGYLEALDSLQENHGFKKRGSAAEFLGLPDLFGAGEEAPDREAVSELVLATLDEALELILAMKDREGETLAVELRGRLEAVSEALERVEAQLPEAKAAMKTNLEERLAELLDGVALDPQRLAQEVAILVDRGDITEETVRLASHLEQFRSTLDAGGEVAKKLGFLLQEILREANTIGSKSSDLAIVREVLLIKEETEKVREQIQNLE